MLREEKYKKELMDIKKKFNDDQDNMFDSGESLAGCTANVSLLLKDRLIVANAGDSRCILIKKNL
jgi:serine/threonine protein phosphatase PrpC